MRLTRRHLSRVLQRKLDSGTLTDEAAVQVRAALTDERAMRLLVEHAKELDGRQDALTAALEAGSDHPVITWLEAHWSQILSAIVAIITLLGML